MIDLNLDYWDEVVRKAEEDGIANKPITIVDSKNPKNKVTYANIYQLREFFDPMYMFRKDPIKNPFGVERIIK